MISKRNVIFHPLQNFENCRVETIEEDAVFMQENNNENLHKSNNNTKLLYMAFFLIIMLVLIIVLFERIYRKHEKVVISIYKPYTDIRSYYSYTLDNGLQAILISDPSCVNPGVALSVHAGSKQEGEIEGLAHLLEHVLFMGSEKYPIDGLFASRVSLANGLINAYTSYEVTVHYWNIKLKDDEKQFNEILDIWANCLKFPLFDKEKIMRKIEEINAEYVNTLTNPEYRLFYLEKLMMNPLSMKSKFIEGSLSSLGKQNIHINEELQKFFNMYYNPNEFNLVMTGNYSLNELKQKTENMFNFKENLQFFLQKTQEKPFISPNSEGFWRRKLAKYQRIEGKELMIAWILPEMIGKYKINPLGYWREILSSEHKEGLIFNLIDHGLIENLSVVYFEDNDMSFFAIHIDLSDKGFNKIDIILKYLMDYLKLIANEGITRERWEEIKIIRDLTYNYKKKNDEIYEIYEISDIARNMIYIQNEDIPNILKYNANLFQEYSYEEIHRVYQYIPLDEALIIVGNENYSNISNNSQFYEKNLAFFQDFSLRNFSELHSMYFDSSEWTSNEIEKLISTEMSSDLCLPSHNPYIPENLSMPCKNHRFCDDFEVNEDIFTNPVLIAKTENHEIWYKKQRNFNKFDPSATFHIKIRAVDTSHSTKDLFLKRLSAKWLKYNLNPLFEQLKNLGYVINFTYNEDLELKISGFVEKMDSITYDLAEIIKNCSKIQFIEEKSEIFSLLKNLTIKDINNEFIKDALQQASNHLTNILSKNRYEDHELGYMENLSIEEFFRYLQSFIHKNFIKGLIIGALDEDKAISIWLKFNSSIINNENPENLTKYQCLKIPESKTKFIQLNRKIEDVNSAIISYFDLGINDIEKIGKYLILAEYFNSKAINYLKTRSKLGFIMGISPWNTNGIMGFIIFVKGYTENIKIFDEIIECFLNDFALMLYDISDEEFALRKQSKIDDLLLISNFDDKQREYWKIIDGNLTNQWNIKEKIVNFIREVDKTIVIEYWKNIIEKREKIARLNIEVFASNLKSYYDENKEFKRYDDFGDEIYEEVEQKIYFI